MRRVCNVLLRDDLFELLALIDIDLAAAHERVDDEIGGALPNVDACSERSVGRRLHRRELQ